MNSIGIIYFTDIYENVSSTYIYGAASLVALKQYCETLRQYSAAVITSITWSAGGEMVYDRRKAHDERKQYIFSEPVQEMALMWSGQPGEAYSLLYQGKCVLKHSQSIYARYAFIPAPLQSIFSRRDLLEAVGLDMAGAFSNLINTTTTYHSGYLCTLPY